MAGIKVRLKNCEDNLFATGIRGAFFKRIMNGVSDTDHNALPELCKELIILSELHFSQGKSRANLEKNSSTTIKNSFN